MEYLFLKCYEFLTVLLPFLVTFLILSQIYKHKKITVSKWHFFMILAFAVYIFFVFYFTGIGTLFDLHRYGIEMNSHQINLLPFSRHIDTVAYLLNILLLMPFGFLVPLIWPNTNKPASIVLSGLSFSLLIEISQLFNFRQTDIDDIVLNTLGALIGYLLFKLIFCIQGRINSSVNHFKIEPIIYVLFLFLGHFLLFDELGFAKILYGF